MDPFFRSYRTYKEWLLHWETRNESRTRSANSDALFREVASRVEKSVVPHGFRLFSNGGRPLLERRYGEVREEIVFVPAPMMHLRPDRPFTVHLHLSSRSISRIRSRYWRPACRAPEVVASGNLGEVAIPPKHYIFNASDPVGCASVVSSLLLEDAVPWFGLFRKPLWLKDRLYNGAVALVNDSTAIELLLSHFDPYEARNFVREKQVSPSARGIPIPELEGFDLESSRVEPLRAYYDL
jgi:hypothetical protein